MEGFSRPGSLGGEAHDDDSVEGHMMDDERIQDTDTEGHGFGLKRASDDDEDTEGHGYGLKRASEDDDTEGHGYGLKRASEDEDDTEGHSAFRGLKATDDDDTEGHSTKIR